MEELGEIGSKKFLNILDFNHRRAMDDLLFRYADEVLQNKESKFFISLSEIHISRRGQSIINEFCISIIINTIILLSQWICLIRITISLDIVMVNY